MTTMLFLPVLLAGAQGADRLPPAKPVPYEQTDISPVLAPVNALFAALAKGDGAAVLAQVYPDGRVTAVGGGPDGATTVRQQSWTQYAERVAPERAFVETISDPAVEVDGDVAMVWAPFTVKIAGKVERCGYDLFDLVREKGAWKIMNITFSWRTTGCPAQ